MFREQRRSLVRLTLLLATAAAAASCLSQPDAEELVLQPVIVTKRDANASFASYTTFAVTDTIPLLNAVAVDAGPTGMTVAPALAQPTMDEIATQLTRRGYRRVAPTATPDLGVAVTAVTRVQAETVTFGGWWGAGGGTTSEFWGLQGGFSSTFNYSTIAWKSGTLIIELYDLRAARAELTQTGAMPTSTGATSALAVSTGTVTIPVIWEAFIHAVVGPPGASLSAPPIAAIQQAFRQSPYVSRATTSPEVSP
jgi:hypothetical protein